MMYSEDDLVMISALQHLLFCPRQCALIHIEQQWTENRLTAEGRILHERVHSTGSESRSKVRVEFDVPVRSLSLGLIGRADIVEFHLQASGIWQPFPVEYKRGRPKKDDSDRVQLCAQALCLEEMLKRDAPEGALYYGQKKRRQLVVFDTRLRQVTADTADQLHSLLRSVHTPLPVFEKKCESCSFITQCLQNRGGMKKHLNTLFVTTQGAYLAKDGETVAVRVDGEVAVRLPIHTLDGIICFGNVGCSPFLMGFCAERDVALSFLSEKGRFLARVQGPVSGNVLLRREQYRRADDPCFSATIAKQFVIGKIANCRTVIKRALRDHPEKVDTIALENTVSRLTASLRRLQDDLTLDEIRGIEGDAAHVYFGAFDNLIIREKEHFFFRQRNRRPPLDRMNCLLSFLYTLLMHDVRSALESVGLDSAVGYLHRDRPGRPGLALDVMEEFRPMVDRLAVSLVNLGQLKPKGFTFSESGAVRMSDAARKTVLVAYQNRKQDGRIHPFLEEKMAIGLFFYSQALLLARLLRDDLDGYPPVILK